MKEGLNKDIWTHTFDVDWQLARAAVEGEYKDVKGDLEVANDCLLDKGYEIDMLYAEHEDLKFKNQEMKYAIEDKDRSIGQLNVQIDKLQKEVKHFKEVGPIRND